ncbi:uncharacterized protein PAC_02600 [Phialocephala subalpina]|uniref:Uncharacterized protein n=1 Tax=Phialocephala subalpina TaxID=576137 RepID=A0A1L7WIX3_9HELO|nr:uncharacterized protein PAC_02600 [Phialocephala subalpina]
MVRWESMENISVDGVTWVPQHKEVSFITDSAATHNALSPAQATLQSSTSGDDSATKSSTSLLLLSSPT